MRGEDACLPGSQIVLAIVRMRLLKTELRAPRLTATP